MSGINIKRGSLVVMLAYFLFVIFFYLIAGEQMRYSTISGTPQMSRSMTTVGEIVKGETIIQPIINTPDVLDGVSLLTATYNRKNTGELVLQIVNRNNNSVLAKKVIKLDDIPNNEIDNISFAKPMKILSGEKLALRIFSNGFSGNAVTLYQNKSTSNSQSMIVNGRTTHKTLVFSLSGIDSIWFGQHYFEFAALVGICLAAFLLHLNFANSRGRTTPTLRSLSAFIKYRFLLNQLIARDFKTKYKRSVLGVLWSLLNPLLTMFVQYVIFSTLFRSNISNFPVYLLVGVVLFNFFMESISMSLSSIVGNASLITKVYVPKYIYPISRVLSSVINLLLSLIPLIVVVIITRTPITPAYLLLPIGIIFIVIYCIGLGMLLSSSMVFFRDTQFLWGVVSMLWMYFTPIFYPASIIPERFMTWYKLNPLYHFVLFVRIIIMQGVSPGPMEYFDCFVSAFGMLVIGVIVFKKTQNRFVLHI